MQLNPSQIEFLRPWRAGNIKSIVFKVHRENIKAYSGMNPRPLSYTEPLGSTGRAAFPFNRLNYWTDAQFENGIRKSFTKYSE